MSIRVDLLVPQGNGLVDSRRWSTRCNHLTSFEIGGVQAGAIQGLIWIEIMELAFSIISIEQCVDLVKVICGVHHP